MANITERKVLFAVGKVVITANANRVLSHPTPAWIGDKVSLHQSGDWGDVCKDDGRVNELAVKEGGMILSCYKSGGIIYWIITEADRSVTTILLPTDY